jgi:signal transduction histidine kinase
VDFIHCSNCSDAGEVLAERDPDIVFVDYNLCPENGLDFIRNARGAEVLKPMVVLTGQGSEAVVMECMRSGADDYVLKSQLSPEILQRAISYAEAQYLRRKVDRELALKNELLRDLVREVELASRAKNEFVAALSHEVRTPLSIIIGYTDLLRARLADNAEVLDELSVIERSGKQLLDLVNDLLDFARLENDEVAVAYRPFTPTAVVQAVYSEMSVKAREKGVNVVETSSGPIPGRVVSDPARIRQVLANLVENAIKFTPEGTVEISTRYLEEEEALEFTVRDSGIGIPQYALADIFDPFKQLDTTLGRNYGGTGLGLAHCQRLARLLRGTLKADSEVGVGSTFVFVVPCRRYQEPADLVEGVRS